MCTCGIRHLLERKDKIDFKLYPSITRKSYKCTSNLESLGFLKRIDFSIVTLYRTMQNKWFKFDTLYVQGHRENLITIRFRVRDSYFIWISCNTSLHTFDIQQKHWEKQPCLGKYLRPPFWICCLYPGPCGFLCSLWLCEAVGNWSKEG